MTGNGHQTDHTPSSGPSDLTEPPSAADPSDTSGAVSLGDSPTPSATAHPTREATDVPWRRLSPRELLVVLVSQLRSLLPLLLLVLLVGLSDDNTWVVAVAVSGALLSLVGTVLTWFTVRWRVTPERLEVRRGLISKRLSSTPLERVRTVDLTASLMRRLLGTVEVVVGTGASDDIKLSGLGRQDGEHLRRALLERSRALHGGPANTGSTSVSGGGESGDRHVVWDGSGAVAPHADTRRSGTEHAHPDNPNPPAEGHYAPGTVVHPRSGYRPLIGPPDDTDNGAGLPRSGQATGQPEPRAPLRAADTAATADGTTPPHAGPTGDTSTVLARLDPRWVAYAPLSLSGLAVFAGAFGALAEILDDVFDALLRLPPVAAAEQHLRAVPVAQAVIEVALLLFAMFAVSAVVTYVFRYWNFLLVRHHDERLHITRGLTTTYSSSIELARLRGLAVEQPVLMGLVHAGKLKPLVAGQAGAADTGADLLLPPAPLREVNRVAVKLLDDEQAVTGPLRQHGTAARRRRHVRALWLPAFVAATCAGVQWWWAETPVSVWAIPVTLLVTAPLLAERRYAALGHQLTDRYLVARSGVFPRRRTVVQRSGVIAWQLKATWFQRRVGLVTLTAVTAAPDGNAEVTDVPEPVAARLLVEVDPAANARHVENTPVSTR